MSHPTPDQIEAATDAMRAESEIWNDIHERLIRCATRVRGLPITEYLNVAILGPFLATYNDVAATFALRCEQGAVQTFSMGVTLYSVAEGYAAAEATNLQGLRNHVESEDGHGQPHG